MTRRDQRVGREAARLRWSIPSSRYPGWCGLHVGLDRSLAHVLASVSHARRSSPKGKRRRPLPLAPTVIKALLELQRVSAWTAPDDPVFAAPATGQPMAVCKLMKRYRKALVAAKLPKEFRFHDLRHTFGTTMARAGVPATTIQAWMGHADLRTTQIYMHYAPAEQDAATIDAAYDLANTELSGPCASSTTHPTSNQQPHNPPVSVRAPTRRNRP
jgi:integrase